MFTSNQIFRLALKEMGRSNNTENAMPTATTNINTKYKLHKPEIENNYF